MSLHKVQYVALVWILLVLGAVIASAPLAWKALQRPQPEKILGWVIIIVILSIPPLILLALTIDNTARNRDVSKWLHNNYKEHKEPLR